LAFGLNGLIARRMLNWRFWRSDMSVSGFPPQAEKD